MKKYVADLTKQFNSYKKKDDFPDSLLFTKNKYKILGTPYHKKPAPIQNEFLIHVSQEDSFLAKFRNIFIHTTITFTSAKTAHRWLLMYDYHCWPQQLNFATWCATSGCGVSLNEDYPPMIQDFLKFHVYFTIRRILNELEIPLPLDTIFSQRRNKYNKVAFAKLCQEFDLPTTPDFRWRSGKNHGLGTVFLHITGDWREATHARARGAEVWPSTPDVTIFADEHGFIKEGRITNKAHMGKQYEWFSPEKGIGLTKAGLVRLNNRSIESFLYCIAGAEAGTRSSITELKGAQKEFLKLFEESIIEDDMAKSISRYQFAIQNAKLKLDFAIVPGLWLIPSNLVLDSKSVHGYNNYLKSATTIMKFGINELVNDNKKEAGINHDSKKKIIKLPHQQKEDRPKIEHKKMEDNLSPIQNLNYSDEYNSHELNKISLIILFGGLGYWLFS